MQGRKEKISFHQKLKGEQRELVGSVIFLERFELTEIWCVLLWSWPQLLGSCSPSPGLYAQELSCCLFVYALLPRRIALCGGCLHLLNFLSAALLYLSGTRVKVKCRLGCAPPHSHCPQESQSRSWRQPEGAGSSPLFFPLWSALCFGTPVNEPARVVVPHKRELRCEACRPEERSRALGCPPKPITAWQLRFNETDRPTSRRAERQPSRWAWMWAASKAATYV